MRDGLPAAYVLYRALWSSVHLGLVGLVVIVGIVWFVYDRQGADLIEAVWDELAGVQHAVANAIPFPWGG